VPDLEAIERRSDPVSSAMQADPLYVRPDAGLGEVIDLMVQWKVGAIPVLEQGSEKLEGIISYVDVLKASRDRMDAA